MLWVYCMKREGFFRELGQGPNSKENSITLTLWWNILYKLDSCVGMIYLMHQQGYWFIVYVEHIVCVERSISVEHIALLMQDPSRPTNNADFNSKMLQRTKVEGYVLLSAP